VSPSSPVVFASGAITAVDTITIELVEADEIRTAAKTAVSNPPQAASLGNQGRCTWPIEPDVRDSFAKITLWYLFFGGGKILWLNRARDGR
jgi:hypothetical protein